MDITVTIHGALMWPVFASMLAGVAVAFMATPSPPRVRIIGAVFVGLLDLQLLLGIVLLFQEGALSTTWRHVGFMVLTLVLAHGFYVRAKRAGFETRRSRVQLFLIPSILLLFGLLQVI